VSRSLTPARHWVYVVALMVLAGALVGAAWVLLAPRAPVRVDSTGAFFVDPAPEQFVAADLVFGLASLVVGVAAGLVVWRVSRERSMAAVVGLAVGGTLGALLGWQLGERLGRVDPAAVRSAPAGSVVAYSLTLTAHGLLRVLPVAALTAWLVRDLAADRRRPGPSTPSTVPE